MLEMYKTDLDTNETKKVTKYEKGSWISLIAPNEEEIKSVLETLQPREQQVLELRFGLIDGTSYTLEEVGKKFNVTRERIRQIEAKALRKLRHPSRAKKLKDFLVD